MLTMKTSYISHVLLLKLICVWRDRSMQGNLFKFSLLEVSRAPRFQYDKKDQPSPNNHLGYLATFP